MPVAAQGNGLDAVKVGNSVDAAVGYSWMWNAHVPEAVHETELGQYSALGEGLQGHCCPVGRHWVARACGVRLAS